jgi:hypothetical protein
MLHLLSSREAGACDGKHPTQRATAAQTQPFVQPLAAGACPGLTPSCPLQGVASFVGGYDMLTGCRLGRVDVRSTPVNMCFTPDASTLVVATQVHAPAAFVQIVQCVTSVLCYDSSQSGSAVTAMVKPSRSRSSCPSTSRPQG